MRKTNNIKPLVMNISYSKRKSWGIYAKYNDGTLTICRYGKTKQEAKEKLIQRINEYYK